MISKASLLVRTRVSENTTSYELSGYFNELSTVPTPEKTPLILLFLDELVGINSIGTTIWCKWVAEMRYAQAVYLERCPFSLIRCFNQVSGALHENMHVLSIKVPFFSERTGEILEVTLKKGEHFDSSGARALPDIFDSMGSKMVLDVPPDFFHFARK